MNSGIYVIENIINRKKYVGSTINLKKRKYTHFSSLKKDTHHNSYLQFSFNKYGEKNFRYYVIAYCLEDKLLKMEDYYIDHFKSMNRNFGYNLALAERHTLTKKHKERISKSLMGNKNNNYGKRRSKEIKNRISVSVRVSRKENPIVVTEKTKIKISESLKRSCHSNLGKPMSEKQKKKISLSVTKAMKGVLKTKEHKLNISHSIKEHWKTRSRTISEEQRQKLSKSLKIYCKTRQKPTKEQKRKISESMKEVWKNRKLQNSYYDLSVARRIHTAT